MARPNNSYNGIKEGEDFYINPHPNKLNANVVTLLKSPYVGIIIEYGRIKFGTENKLNGTIDCQFDYDIIETSGKTKQELEQNPDFLKFVGDVLMEILWSQIGELDEYSTGFRNNNT